MTGQLVQALQAPACYPHPTGAIRLIETHISWVLLTGDFVYKIKKPVNFGFLDFSTLDKRKFYCEEELRLNSRFSSDLYLAVVAVRGSLHEPHVDAAGNTPRTDGEVLDYAVKMRQFDQHALLKSLADSGELGLGYMQPLARKLAEFHRHGAAPLEAGDLESGTPESIADSALENFRQIAPLLQDTDQKQTLDRLLQWTRQQIKELGTTFARRRADGWVRECHGDLHLRNIACIDGELTFFDCIEFSAPLRRIDVQSELAFLLMDLEKQQLPEYANGLLNSYLEYSGDYRGLAVLPFYKVYRAMVRAKVAALGIAGAAQSGANESALWQEYDSYMSLAQSCSEPRQPFLALMHGVSGTGKSTVAATLAGELGAVRLRSDVERKRLFGLSPEARSDESRKEDLYGEEASARTFATLAALAAALLDLRWPVLVDATFIAARWRRPFLALARAQAVPLMIIDCQASPATLRQRLRLRQHRGDDASEAGIEVMKRQLESVEPFSADELPHVIGIDTEQPVHAGPLRAFLAAFHSSGNQGSV